MILPQIRPRQTPRRLLKASETIARTLVRSSGLSIGVCLSPPPASQLHTETSGNISTSTRWLKAA